MMLLQQKCLFGPSKCNYNVNVSYYNYHGSSPPVGPGEYGPTSCARVHATSTHVGTCLGSASAQLGGHRQQARASVDDASNFSRTRLGGALLASSQSMVSTVEHRQYLVVYVLGHDAVHCIILLLNDPSVRVMIPQTRCSSPPLSG